MEELYLFNPFRIKSKTEIELKEMYEEMYKELIKKPNTMYEYAHNIEVYSNLNYIVGECIARLTKDLIELKTQIEKLKAQLEKEEETK